MSKFIKVTATKDGVELGRAIIAIEAIDALVERPDATEVILRGKESTCLCVKESYNELVAALS